MAIHYYDPYPANGKVTPPALLDYLKALDRLLDQFCTWQDDSLALRRLGHELRQTRRSVLHVLSEHGKARYDP